MTIRGYHETDLQGVLDLLEELRGSLESARFSNYLMDSGQYKQVYLQAKNYYVLVALIEDKVVGFMIAEHYLNDIANLVMLYVGKNYRKQNIALTLKKMMESLCYANGYKKIVSQVRMNNIESIKLNEKAGWTKEIDKVYPNYYYWFTKEL